MTEATPHRSYIATVINCYCPRCRRGKLFQHPLSLRFKRNLEMYEKCPVCGQPTDIEVGFYYGTSYVSYLVAVAISGASLLLWWLIICFSFSDNRFFWWMGFNAVLLIALQPWLMRVSRSLWISFFVKYDPDWPNHKPDNYERIIEGQMNNW